MSDLTKLSALQFQESEGVGDWRVLPRGASAHFVTGGFSKGVAFVSVIAELADAANHHPDVDLRYGGVTIRLFTHEAKAVTDRDLDLARRISAVAGGMGVTPDPSKLAEFQIAIDALDIVAVRDFWVAILDHRPLGDDHAEDKDGRLPNLYFQQLDTPRPDRNRIHIDLFLPHDQVEARINAGIAAGGRLLSDSFAPYWWTLADPEGNEVDIACVVGREEAADESAQPQ